MSLPRRRLVAAGGLAIMLCACQPDLADQPKYETYEAAPYFENGRSAREPVPGTVATDARPAGWRPPRPALEHTLLSQGREAYEVYCAPCHGSTGRGDGMIVRRGFPAPPSLHLARLRQAPDTHFYDVITRGYGVMYSYAARVRPAQRWAITAYIRALQFSQQAPVAALPAAERLRLPPTDSEAAP